jgi:hypothetical protein
VEKAVEQPSEQPYVANFNGVLKNLRSTIPFEDCSTSFPSNPNYLSWNFFLYKSLRYWVTTKMAMQGIIYGILYIFTI